MFKYQGLSNKFQEAIFANEKRLERLYKDILKDRYSQVTRLISPSLYYTILKDESHLDKLPIINPLLDTLLPENMTQQSYTTQSLSKKQEFFVHSTLLGLIDEAFVSELEKRVLLELGYNPEYIYEGQPLESDPLKNTRVHIAKLDYQRLLNYIRDWHTTIENEIFLNLLKSLKKYKIVKVNSQVLSQKIIEERLQMGMNFFYSEPDSYALSLILQPDLDKIRIEDNGKLVLQNTTTMVITPLIVLSEVQVENDSARFMKYNLPPHLCVFIHEFHHLLTYSLQKYPTMIASGLFQIKATRGY